MVNQQQSWGEKNDLVCLMSYPLAIAMRAVSDYHLLLNVRKQAIKGVTCYKLLIEFCCNLETFRKQKSEIEDRSFDRKRTQTHFFFPQ